MSARAFVLAALVSVTASAITAQTSQTPLDPPRNTELASPVVDVPLIKNGDFYFVDVLLNGKPFRFTVETGASFFGIGPHVATAAGLTIDSTAGPAGVGPGGGRPQYARVATLSFGGVTLSGLTARVSPTFDGSGFVGDGIISLAAYRELLATFDFRNRRLRLERGALPPPNGRDIVPILGQDRGGRADIPFEIGGVTIPMVIDTRSHVWFVIPDSLESRIALASPARPIGEARGPAMGTFQLRGARATADLRVGNVTVRQPALEFRNRPGAVVGMPFLEQVVVTIDQANKRVRIVRADDSAIAVPPLAWETADASVGTPQRRTAAPPTPVPGQRTMGFNVAGTPGGLFIRNVVAGSSANTVGLRERDQLVELDGTPVASLNANVFRAAAARGTPVKVVVEREGRRIELMVEPYVVPDVSSAERELLAMDSTWARNYATHDTVTAMRLMSEDFFMTSSNGAIKDREAELRDVRSSPGLRMHYFRTSQVQVRMHATSAVVTGLAEWSFELNGRTSVANRAYTAVYTRGGPLAWQLAVLNMRNAGAAATADASLRRSADSLVQTMVAAFKRDPASVAQHYTDDARIVGGGRRTVGREQVAAYWSGSTGFTDWSLEILDVGGEPGTPWVIGRSILRNADGRAMTTEFVGVLRRGDDGLLRFYLDRFARAQ